MNRPIIEVKNLSKKYRITHQESYLALRDIMAACLKKPFEIFRNRAPLSSKEDFWALKDISFDVKQGEVVGIIGRNGAGKTTLLKILSRITSPTKGEIRLCGRVGSLLEVGTGFHPELTGRENIYFNGSILGMKKREIDKKFDKIVDFSGVENFLDTPVKRFSSGMQVRLAFSVAAYLDPEILIVDEVLAVGDSQFQQKCLGKMKEVSEGGRTVLFVSHNMAAIKNLCKRTILLDGGGIILDANTEIAISQYLGQNLHEGTRVSEKDFERKIEGVIKKDNPTICLKEIALFDKNGLPKDIFYSDEAIGISVSYQCLIPVSDLRVVIQIVDEENRPILITQNLDDPDELNLYEHQPGTYKSSCFILPDTFGERCFYVSVQLLYPKTEHLVLNKVLKFEVKFKGYNNVQYGTFEYSFLRPQLKWKTESFIDSKKQINLFTKES
ncbi:MAG: polysaccharide ABC transporter ATP-binding protein [Candidatus Omnitrophota bacterium]